MLYTFLKFNVYECIVNRLGRGGRYTMHPIDDRARSPTKRAICSRIERNRGYCQRGR